MILNTIRFAGLSLRNRNATPEASLGFPILVSTVGTDL